MNNIYKVIWSKAKNCYVVASEIAKSHTKSASGSEKMGGYGKRALLALAAASAIFCGGLVNVGAVDTVHVDESGTPATAQEVYTKAAVDTALDKKADKGSVYTKADTYTKTEVNTAVDKKADKDSVYTKAETYTKTEVNEELAKKADASNVFTKDQTFTKDQVNVKLADYAKTTDVNTALAGKANAADVYTKTDVDGKLANKADKATTLTGYGITDAYTKTEVDAAVAGLAGKADQTALDAATNRITTNEGNITDLQKKTAKLSDDGKELTGMTTVSGTTVSGTNVEANALKVTGEISNGAGVTTTLTDIKASMTQTATNKTDIEALKTKTTGQQTAIDGLNEKTTKITYDAALGTNVDGVTFNAGAVTGVTSINGTEIGTKESGEYIHQDNSIWGNMKKVDTQVKTNADDIAVNKAAITALDTKVGTVGTGTYLDPTKSVGENLGHLDAGLKKEVDDRTAAVEAEKAAREAEDTNLSNRIGTVTEDGEYIKKSATNNVSENLKVLDNRAKTNADAIAETNQRTAGITRDDIRNETSIEGKVTVDTNGNIKAEGAITSKGLDAGDGDIKTNGKVSAGVVSTGTLETTGDATIGGDLKVNGTLNTKDVAAETIHISKSENKPDYKSEGSIIGEGGKLSVSNEKFDKINNITEKSELNVNEKGTVNWATSTDNATGNVTEGRSEVTADNIKNSVKKTEGGTTFGYEENITADGKVGTVTDKDGNRNELTQTATGTENTVTSKDGNKSTTKQEAGSISSTVYDKDGNVKASSEMKEDGSISNNATGDMTNTVGGKLTTTVTGATEENYNGGLTTKVTGEEKHTVTGKQTNTVEGGQENIISGGQTNTITGGQINNITGDQTTTVTDGNISNTAKNITNEATGTLTDQVGTNTRVTTSTSITDTVGTANRKIENDKITDTAGDSTVTTENGKGTTFAKTGSTEFSTEAGAPTDTNIAGNHITTGRVDANELGVSDKDGANTADLSVKAGEGVKASAGNGTTTGSLDVKADEVVSSVKDADGKGSTFKQRIEAIMMESKDVSIKAEETLTNEAKVITNKASEVINNEAININNTATGIITSKASEIKNQADKLISNKVGENTWENMEDGKITTSIKDGTKQNLTQSDAAGTTQSTVDGAKSTVTIQNADGLTGAVTDGRNTSVQNQTASQIAAAVKDGAGNENASVANATTSANTITNGTKANTVISTADGTSFINSDAMTPVTGASGAGTAVNTKIKGNTITTGKVTMDYADVMKDLGVHGSATVDNDLTVKGITTTKTLNVTEDASVGRNLAVGGNATIRGDVTANSYKVGDKTYIDANGINANNQKITNVADGSISEGSKDAVNGGQLYGVKRDLEHQVDKVGANAAAMANLRPMEFDPSSKWNIAAAIGNYGSETAAALGAFYRPNDNVMVNLSTAFGTGENMVGGGVSVRLGKGGNKLSREETNALKAQVNDLTARMDALLSVLNPNMSKDFPDVPENHWAYEAVSRLAGNDIVQGYPDGEFHGERTMTRYEMAEIIYNALSRGAEAERELVEEFKPELQAMAASEKATAEKAEG